MAQILHIKDAYFELPEKCKDDIGCMVTLLGLHLQQNKDVADSEQCKIEYEISLFRKVFLMYSSDLKLYIIHIYIIFIHF